MQGLSLKINRKKKNELTSKYRKKEYMIKYDTINGANIAFKMPMNINLRLNLVQSINST